MSINTETAILSPFRIDWSEKVRIEAQFRTGVFRAKDGTEQRWRERMSPRVKISFTSSFLRRDKLHAAMATLRSNPNGVFLMEDLRLRARVIHISADRKMVRISSDEFTVPLSPGVTVLLSQTGSDPSVAKVSSIVDRSFRGDIEVYLVEAIPEEFSPGSSRLTSLVHVTLATSIGTTLLTSDVGQVSVVAETVPGRDPLEVPVTDGENIRPLPAMLRHDWGAGLEIEDEITVDEIDFSYGLRERYLREMAPSRTFGVQIQASTNAKSRELRSFMSWTSGRLRPFWMFDPLAGQGAVVASTQAAPVGYGDTLRLALDAPISGLDIRDLKASLKPRFALRTRDAKIVLCALEEAPVFQTDLHLRVTGIHDEGDYTVVSQKVTLTPETILELRPIKMCRLASDNLTMEHLSDSVFNVKLKFQELVDK